MDPRLLLSAQEKSEEDDPEPLKLRQMIDIMYEKNSKVFGFMGIKCEYYCLSHT
jgi:hypothetical protein